MINHESIKPLLAVLDIIDYTPSNLTIESKEDKSFVTNIDFLANASITSFFNDFYGKENVNLISEENTNKFNEQITYNIIVDPIDGTENLVNRIPIFGISISIYKNNKSHYHILYFPMLKECITSDKRVKYDESIESRLILLSSNVSLEDVKLYNNKEFRLYGCATYNMASIITNKAFMYTNLKANSYDILAGINIALLDKNISIMINDKPYTGEFLHRDIKYKIVMRRKNSAQVLENDGLSPHF